MCDHSDDKEHTYLKIVEHPDYEVYVCECGALTNIQDPKNYHDPCVPMTADEIERMLIVVTPISDVDRLREIANLKRVIWEEDKHSGTGLLVRDDEVALGYQRLTKEARCIMRKLIGAHFWRL